jgi:hypothetical protein
MMSPPLEKLFPLERIGASLHITFGAHNVFREADSKYA